MATWHPGNLIVKGAEATFHQRLDEIPTIYQNHCALLGSTTAVEQYVFPGFIPVPREFVDGRNIQGLRDFTFSVENNEFELSIAINRKHFEDDQTDLIASRMREIAEVWGTFKDSLFATLLVNGGTAGFVAFDGTTFFNDSRTIGSSGTIVNKLTSAATGTTIPTATEFLLGLNSSKTQMRKFFDDQARPFNSLAIKDLRVIMPPAYETPSMEALNATFIVGDAVGSTTGNKSNVFVGMAQPDVLDYLSAETKMYITAVAAERMPFIYQERTPLEVIILDDPPSVALHNAVLVLCRQRFVFAYGEPRRCIEYTYS